MSEKLRTGITTGTCAAAAAKAAVLAALMKKLDHVEVASPQGRLISVPIAGMAEILGGGKAWVIKDAGDDPDITNGIELHAEVVFTELADIDIKAGIGVGIVTKPGLAVTVGQPAINPGPRQMIISAIRQVLPEHTGAIVTISIPGGVELARRTLNPTLGIVGGLSIIGTTGIVEPMSEEAFKNSLFPQISIVKALGFSDVVFVPGKIGQNIAIGYGLPENQVIQTSNFVGYMLEKAVSFGMKRVLLFGHLGKLAKVAAGNFHTHNRIADARMETIAAYLALQGAPADVVREVLECTTTEAAIPIIERNALNSVYNVLAERASIRAERYVFGDLLVGAVIVTLKGEILGMNDTARVIGGEIGWNIK